MYVIEQPNGHTHCIKHIESNVWKLTSTLFQVLFSPRDTRKTRKICEKLGMDLDFNTSISLSSEQENVVNEAEVWELKARLPRGIEAIRNHIAHVDDVPLRVSIFTDTAPDTAGAMLETMREYGEIVMCAFVFLSFIVAS
jgi:hypothetical protein